MGCNCQCLSETSSVFCFIFKPFLSVYMRIFVMPFLPRCIILLFPHNERRGISHEHSREIEVNRLLQNRCVKCVRVPDPPTCPADASLRKKSPRTANGLMMPGEISPPPPRHPRCMQFTREKGGEGCCTWWRCQVACSWPRAGNAD